MSLILDGTNGLSDVDGSAATPAIRGTDANTGIFFPAADTIAFSEGGAEVMRLDASGRLIVGADSAVIGNRIEVVANTSAQAIGIRGRASDASGSISWHANAASTEYAKITSDNTSALVFSTGSSGTERARIDSSGNYMIGTTVVLAKLSIVGNAGASNATLYASNENGTSGDYTSVFALGANSNNTSSVFLLCTNPSVANRFIIYGNGTYGTVSDQRLKKNIETTRDGYLDDLMNLRVVKYNWNSQEDGEPKELGVIAQEIEQVFPALVQESKAPNADTAYKQVKTSVLPFMLLKALQEQQAIIESLKARLDAANL